MAWSSLAIGALVVWRLTFLLQAEAGPWGILDRLRSRLPGRLLPTLFGCFYCLSAWVAFPCAWLLAEDWRHRLLLWPALSAAAIMLESLRARGGVPSAAWQEDPPEDGDGLLRPEPIDHAGSKDDEDG